MNSLSEILALARPWHIVSFVVVSYILASLVKREVSSTHCSVSRKDSFIAAEVAKTKRDFRNLVVRFLTGPILFTVLLGALASYGEFRYRETVQDFHKQLAEDRANSKKFVDHLYGDSLQQSRLEQNRLNLYDELRKTMIRGHAHGYHPLEDHVFFQLIDGYQSDGEPVWSDEVHVYRLSPHRQCMEKISFRLQKDFHSSAPATPSLLWNALESAVLDPSVSGFTRYSFGITFVKFTPTDQALADRPFDVKLEIGMQSESKRGILIRCFYENFPPCPLNEKQRDDFVQ